MGGNPNEEIARRVLEAGVAGDIDGFVGDLADDVEMDMRAVPDGGIHRGADEVLAYLRQHRQAWRDVSIEITHVESHGDLVAIVFVERAVGQSSGIAVEDPSADLFEFRGRSIARIKFFNDPDDALAAVREGGWD